MLGVCAVLSAAGLRTVLVRPPAHQARSTSTADSPSRAPEALAEAFARAYLTWDPAHLPTHDAEVRRFAPGLVGDDQSAPRPPADRQVVRWSSVADDRAAPLGRRITVVTETNHGPIALAVTIVTDPQGRLRVSGPPAVVGSPPVSRDSLTPASETVEDAEVGATVSRALRNFLRGRRGDLDADLLPGAVVVLPDRSMRLAAIEEMTWTSRDRVVGVVVRADLPEGSEMRLAYDVGVSRQAGRWFVRWIENQPSTSGRAS